MPFQGERASYAPLKRIVDNPRIKELMKDWKIQEREVHEETWKNETLCFNRDFLSLNVPNLILAVDGSRAESDIKNGFPCATVGYVTVASVLLDMKKVREVEASDFIDPVAVRQTETVSSIEAVFPGANIIAIGEKNAKSTFRRVLFETLKRNQIFSGCETLLDTYEYLFKLKRGKGDNNPPKSPIDGMEGEKMQYGYGEYVCEKSGEALFSTDALRLHELMNNSTSNADMFTQTMDTLEKLWFVHVLRSFEQNNWLPILHKIAFVLDGPLAVFGTSSWLTKVIGEEITRINNLQKKYSHQDMIIIGVEKTGAFVNHFESIDTGSEGEKEQFPRKNALLLNDNYIKRNIIFSAIENGKPYGQDTYFGRKLFYKTSNGQRIVASVATYTKEQADISTAYREQFPRLADIMNLLDKVYSSRYPNAILPLVSAHAEAAIPLHLGNAIFEKMAKELKNNN